MKQGVTRFGARRRRLAERAEWARYGWPVGHHLSSFLGVLAAAMSLSGAALADPALPLPSTRVATPAPAIAPPLVQVKKSAPSAVNAPLRLEPRVDKPDLVWDPRWSRVGTLELVTTGLVGVGAVSFAVVPPLGSPWPRASSFDESARNALRLRSQSARDITREATDIMLTVSVTYPFFVDALAAAHWRHKSRDVAWQMAEIDLETLAVNAFVSALVSNVTNHQRPYGRLCPTDPAHQDASCSGTSRYRSFFSGHTSTSFASAGLVCSHHMHFKLFGGGAPDAIACATSLVFAGAVASMRVLSDQHYLTDVLVGSAVGLVNGFGLPWLLHYRGGSSVLPGSTSTKPGGVTWTLAPAPFGGSLFGTF